MHEELISLRRLTLQGEDVPFDQAFLVWRRERLEVRWSGTVRVAAREALPAPGEEAAMEALSLDGRAISGRVLVTSSDDGPVLALEGLGELTVDGRRL